MLLRYLGKTKPIAIAIYAALYIPMIVFDHPFFRGTYSFYFYLFSTIAVFYAIFFADDFILKYYDTIRIYKDPDYPDIMYYCGNEETFEKIGQCSNRFDELDEIVGCTITHPSGVVFSVNRPGRHHHVIRGMGLLGVGGMKNTSKQGFVTRKGFILNRRNAYRIAIEAKQFLSHIFPVPGRKLFSDDIWESDPNWCLVEKQNGFYPPKKMPPAAKISVTPVVNRKTKRETITKYKGEPSFTLFGRDPQAPELIRKWANDREQILNRFNTTTTDEESISERLCQMEKIAWAREIADEMEKWKSENQDKGVPSDFFNNIQQPKETT